MGRAVHDDVFRLTFEDIRGLTSSPEAIRDLGSGRAKATRSATVTARRYADRTTGLPREGRFLCYFGFAADYVEFPYQAKHFGGSGNAITSGDFFVGGWVYYPSAPTSGNYYPISVTDSSRTAAGTGWGLCVFNGRIGFVWSDGTTVRTYDRSAASASLSAAGFYYIAAERYNGRVYLSVGGVVKESFDCSHTLNVPTGGKIRLNAPHYSSGSTMGLTFHDLWQIKRRAPFRGGNFQAPRLSAVNLGPIVYDGGPRDPLFSSMSLFLPLQGANGSTTFADISSSPATVTNNGSTAVDTSTDPFSDGLGAASFAANQYLATNRSPVVTTGAFSLKCWIRRTGTPGAAGRIITAQTGVNPFIRFYLDTANKLAGGVRDTTGAFSVAVAGSTTLAINTWYQVELTRSASGILDLWVNDVNDGTASSAGHDVTGAPAWEVGGIGIAAAGQFFPGLIRDVQILENVTRPAGFSSPATRRPDLH